MDCRPLMIDPHSGQAHNPSPRINTFLHETDHLLFEFGQLLSNVTYRVETRPSLNLSDWQALHTFTGATATTNWSTAPNPDRGVFRLVAGPQPAP